MPTYDDGTNLSVDASILATGGKQIDDSVSFATAASIVAAEASNAPLSSRNLIPVGAITLFTGIVSDIELGRSYAKVKVKSNLELFNIQWPMNIYMACCSWQLYGPGCGLWRDAFTDHGTVQAGSTTKIVNVDITDTSVYTQGVIRFTSGLLTGIVRTLWDVQGSANQLQVVQPLPVAPDAGDAFTVYPGCDKSQVMCNERFGNSANFRGFPYIPTPETGV
jgi:uncharacterized phage protein (TIGR02218 family)